jgi:hypothetical protein
VAAGWYVYGGREAPGQLVVELLAAHGYTRSTRIERLRFPARLGSPSCYIYEGKPISSHPRAQTKLRREPADWTKRRMDRLSS